MILKNPLRVKGGVPKTLVKQKLRLHSLYSVQNAPMFTESRGEFSDLHSSFRLRALRYCIKMFKHRIFGGEVRGKICHVFALRNMLFFFPNNTSKVICLGNKH